MSKLKELLQDYHNGYLTTPALSRKLLAMDKRDETYGRTGDSRIRRKLKDYLRQPMDPLDVLVEQRIKRNYLRLSMRLPRNYHRNYWTCCSMGLSWDTLMMPYVSV